MLGTVHTVFHLIHLSNVGIIPTGLFEIKGASKSGSKSGIDEDQDINYEWKVIQHLSGGIRPEPRISEIESLMRNCITSTQMLRSFLLIRNTH